MSAVEVLASRRIDRVVRMILEDVVLLDGPIQVGASGHELVTLDRKSTRLNSSHVSESRMPSSA